MTSWGPREPRSQLCWGGGVLLRSAGGPPPCALGRLGSHPPLGCLRQEQGGGGALGGDWAPGDCFPAWHRVMPARPLSLPRQEVANGGEGGGTPQLLRGSRRYRPFPFLSGAGGADRQAVRSRGLCPTQPPLQPPPFPTAPKKQSSFSWLAALGGGLSQPALCHFSETSAPPIPASCECSAGLAPEGRPQGRRGSETPPQAHTNTPQPTRASQMGGWGRDARPLSY